MVFSWGLKLFLFVLVTFSNIHLYCVWYRQSTIASSLIRSSIWYLNWQSNTKMTSLKTQRYNSNGHILNFYHKHNICFQISKRFRWSFLKAVVANSSCRENVGRYGRTSGTNFPFLYSVKNLSTRHVQNKTKQNKQD